MKPDSRIDGRKKKNVICIACSWFRASVEKVKPTREVGGDEQRARRASSSDELPSIGTSNSSRAATRMTPTWT